MVAISVLTLGALFAQALAMPAATESAAVSATTPTAASTSLPVAESQLDDLAGLAYDASIESVKSDADIEKRGGCSLSSLRVRRDWRTFSKTQKTSYINSILCLQKLPSLTPSELAPGARSRYDDFVATHINQTTTIHYTGTFLAWHRYYIWNFEEAMRNECGYTGDYPYWNWGADAADLEKSQVFDGSDTSMSGNGAHVESVGDIQLSLGTYPVIHLPTGNGGGCVTSGPFKDYSVNLGPVALMLPGGETGSTANPLAYNPRCLKRDLSTKIVKDYANFTAIVDLILRHDDIYDFQMNMQGVPGSGNIGVHGGGHYSMGGDPSRDVFVSPGDPAFWLHHGMIDRTWWIWQNLNLHKRLNAISGTGTFLNGPPSPNTTLDTLIELGYAGGETVAMRDLMSTISGPFCYIYL
ncbi:Tyrosinase [Penicillium coprophilum]|uniref:Tyrosinase n=1 Tax=Penicillium coprophilum TaxID=36646 RepID=UPI002390FD67|nr:Tyrosinase [Penicillium coprophilum]XP_056536029.1 Tyrosinase [Penicillium coprophilum]KAJ5150777.1 Tyrosinase [Penicillium coprophilum]KAJ5171575.1 Tyrosinase [Penicillium coprophilum]